MPVPDGRPAEAGEESGVKKDERDERWNQQWVTDVLL